MSPVVPIVLGSSSSLATPFIATFENKARRVCENENHVIGFTFHGNILHFSSWWCALCHEHVLARARTHLSFGGFLHYKIRKEHRVEDLLAGTKCSENDYLETDRFPACRLVARCTQICLRQSFAQHRNHDTEA